MKRILSLVLTLAFALSGMNSTAGNAAERKSDMEIISRVARWQMEHHPECRHHKLDWTNGALYRGLADWAEYTSDDEIFDFLQEIGESNGWEIHKTVHTANDLCVGQMYTRMYARTGDPSILEPLKYCLDDKVNNPCTDPLQYDMHGSDRWSWCDALFMAPPTYADMYAIFKDEKYLQYLDREFKECTDSLYSHEDGFYFRDRFYLADKVREPNGARMFWGRGNGWVFAGLASLLESLPKDHSTYGYYLGIFREMADAVVSSQRSSGSWCSSLLDPEDFPQPENSGSSFYVYGLAWGINHGILTGKAYENAALKGWEALKSYVGEDGFLGHIQRIGEAPEASRPRADETEVYGVGAFLLAGTQMMQFGLGKTKKQARAFARDVEAGLAAAEASKPRDREYWLSEMLRMADPVVNNLSQGTLNRNIPVETNTTHHPERPERYVSGLEAYARMFCGMSPWLNLGPDETPEGQLRAKYIDLWVKGIRNAFDPASPDYMTLDGKTAEAVLVDAAHFAQGLLRAKDVIWPALDDVTKGRIISELKLSRSKTPYETNWLMFSAMVETALLEFGSEGDYDMGPVNHALEQHAKWYKGDGWYGDGEPFHLDYYNSYVIQPMILEICAVLKAHGMPWGDFYDTELGRMVRFAVHLERMISPEGTFPPVGRSLTYKFGAFQNLSLISLLEQLPRYIEPAQVRCALTAVMKNQLRPGTYDENGWLTIGFCGHQPLLVDGYSSTGSVYLCSIVFLPLGLPADNEFWTAPAAQWTSQRAWSGLPIRRDHSIK